MNSTTTILPATVEDIDALLPMVEQYWRFENIEGFDPARMRALLTRVLEDASLGRVWVARVYGEPAGYLLAVYVFSLEFQGLTAEIDEFYVIPEHRSLGIGAAMLVRLFALLWLGLSARLQATVVTLSSTWFGQ